MLCHMNLHLYGSFEVLDEFKSNRGNVVDFLVFPNRAECSLLDRLCEKVGVIESIQCQLSIQLQQWWQLYVYISICNTTQYICTAYIYIQVQYVQWSSTSYYSTLHSSGQPTSSESLSEEVVGHIGHLAEDRQVGSALDLQPIGPGLAYIGNGCAQYICLKSK